MNQKNNREFAEKLWKCDGCGNLDTQCYLMWCPAYAPLREGLDIDSDVDVVKYFQEVFKLRETLPLWATLAVVWTAAQARGPAVGPGGVGGGAMGEMQWPDDEAFKIFWIVICLCSKNK